MKYKFCEIDYVSKIGNNHLFKVLLRDKLLNDRKRCKSLVKLFLTLSIQYLQIFQLTTNRLAWRKTIKEIVSARHNKLQIVASLIWWNLNA